MSFWSDASGLVKGAIILGIVGVLGVVALTFMGGSDEPQAQQRGLSAQQ